MVSIRGKIWFSIINRSIKKIDTFFDIDKFTAGNTELIYLAAHTGRHSLKPLHKHTHGVGPSQDCVYMYSIIV